MKVQWKYILHAFHWAAHLDYQHIRVQHVSMLPTRLVKDWKRLNLCFAVVGLRAHNVYVDLKFCCKKKNVILEAKAGEIVAPVHEKDSVTAALFVWDEKDEKLFQ